MTVHDTELPEIFDDFARHEGFNPHATVVPSAAGMPLPSKLEPEAAQAHANKVLRAAGKALKSKAITITP
jgi:hypothetical protein